MLVNFSAFQYVLIAITLTLAVVIAPAYAAEFPVTPTTFAVADGGTNDTIIPFDTMSNFYQLDVPAGSTIIFADGEYELDSHLDINKGDITLKAAEGATPILIATNKDQRIIGYDGSGSLSNITIDGLTFRAALGHQWSWGMINFETGSLSNITITNNVFENSNLVPIRIGDHIYTPDQWSNITISNNTFRDISHKVGVYLFDAKDTVISGNTFSNLKQAINLDHPKNVHIYDNQMIDVDNGISVGLNYDSGTRIYDNTIIHGNYQPQLDDPYATIPVPVQSYPWAEGLPVFTQTLGIKVIGAGGVEVYDNFIDGFDTGFFIYHEPHPSVPEDKRSLYNSTDRTNAVVSKNTFTNNKNSTIYNAVPDYKLPVILNTFLDKDPAKDDVVHGDVGTFISYDSMGHIVVVDENSNAVTSEQSCAIVLTNTL